MADYKRFIAYFYEYIDGKKHKNAGFVKVELRNGIWRVLFRLTMPMLTDMILEVQGFVRKDGYQLCIPLGRMRTGKNMTEEWTYQYESSLCQEGYRFGDFAGLRILSQDQREFLTIWDDDQILMNHFVERLPEDADNIEMEMAEEISPEISVEESMEEFKEESSVEEFVEESVEASVEESDEEFMKEKNCDRVCDDLFRRRQRLEPFQNQEITVCVQIQPCDIIGLQQAGWDIGQSSFMHHAYYQYRHVLLGKDRDGEIIVGVPGTDEESERYMAGLFGFEQFRLVKIYSCGKRFGYWCRRLKLR